MDEVLNVGFFVFHTLWMAFNCLGWVWRRTRRLHLVTVGLTAGSWFGLGISHGWGYCPFTDWHWQVRARLGHRDPDSYTQLLLQVLLGLDLLPSQADALTACVFAMVAILSVTLNMRDRRQTSGGAR